MIVYAARATNNIAEFHTPNGKATIHLQGITGDDQNNSFATVDTAYECCVFAFTQTFSVAMWQFAEGTCIIYNAAGGAQFANTYRVFRGPKNRQSIFGNDPRGEMTEGRKTKREDFVSRQELLERFGSFARC